jgi:hypothetical protein
MDMWAGNLVQFGSKHVYANVYVVACRVGIRADLVCKIDHLASLRLVDIWQTNPKFSGDSEPTFRAWSDSDSSCDSSIGRDPDFQLLGGNLDCTQETRCKELLRVCTFASRATEFLGNGELQIDLAILGAGSSIPASDGGG